MHNRLGHGHTPSRFTPSVPQLMSIANTPLRMILPTCITRELKLRRLDLQVDRNRGEPNLPNGYEQRSDHGNERAAKKNLRHDLGSADEQNKGADNPEEQRDNSQGLHELDEADASPQHADLTEPEGVDP